MDQPTSTVAVAKLPDLDGAAKPFCEACAVFEISNGEFPSNDRKENRACQLGSYEAISKRISCPLCRLITQCFKQGPVQYGPKGHGFYKLEELHVSASWGKDFSHNGDWKWASPPFINIWLHAMYAAGSTFIKAGLVNPAKLHQDHLSAAKESHIDSTSVKGWLAGCEASHICLSHEQGKTGEYKTPAMFRCIDVNALCITCPPSECRYVTLSYVWGLGAKFVCMKDNLKRLSTPLGLQVFWSQLSQTIKDAILLTQKLGESYLWVDSLCIVQDADEEEKTKALNDMGRVYDQGLLMISAADDRCPTDGLRGIGTPRKQRYYTSQLSPSSALAASFDLSDYMKLSTYETRGWTYQEEEYSRRTLVFINDQVYFRCLGGTRTDNFTAFFPRDDINLIPAQNKAGHPISSFFEDRPYQCVSMKYFRSVEKYTDRTLTYPSDILNAFAGILAIQEREFRSESYKGLPTAIFDMALLWQPFRKLQYRDGFPSWSWTGWEGPVIWAGDTVELTSYAETREQEHRKVDLWHQNQTWIEWYGMLDALNSECTLLWEAEGSVGSTLQDFSAVGYKPSNCSPENPFGRSYDKNSPPLPNIPTLRPPPPAPEAPLLSYLLCFSSFSVHFRIRPSNAYLRYGSIDPSWEPRGRVVFLLMNNNNAVCGYVLLDDDWVPQPSTSAVSNSTTSWTTKCDGSEPLHEFILLSKANYHCEWQRPHEAHPYTKSYKQEAYIEVHAMMITQKNSISKRVGLGRIHQEALQDAWEGPVWKDFVLG